MTSLLMSSSPINILHWRFWCRYSNSRDELQVLLPFAALLPERPGELARRLVSSLKWIIILIKFFHKEVKWKWNNISALQCNVREAKKGNVWNLLFQEVALTVLINPFLFIVESFISVNINIQNLYMYVCNMPIAWHKLCSEGCFRDGSEKLIQCFRLHYTFLLTCQMRLTNKVSGVKYIYRKLSEENCKLFWVSKRW